MVILQAMYRPSVLSDRLRQLAAAFPVVVVSGARQVGKTTLMRHVFPDHDYVVFDANLDQENARREPDLFLQNHRPPVILDEIQYAPEVVAGIKRLIDREPGKAGQYLSTGSQQWQVLRSPSESLAGRAAFLDLSGPLFATGVACELTKQASAMATRPAIHHWRAAGGAAVDLVLERDGVLYPFEIKLTAAPGRRHASGIEAFRAAHPHRRIGLGALICAVERPRWLSEKVIAIPWNLC